MPELPEVETIRLQLDQVLTGRKISQIEVLKEKSFQGDKKLVLGLKILQVSRRAKIILVKLERDLFLAIHLKLTGQLIFQDKTKIVCDQKNGPYAVCDLPNKYTRVIITFDNQAKLFFNDLRIFGWIKIIKNLKEIGEENLGPEANDKKTFSLNYFEKILGQTKKPIKLVILDQQKIAGIGNIYANEALFKAHILPIRPSSSLKKEEIKKLREAILTVLNLAIKYKGSSDKDEAYRQITGEKGSFQNQLMVYGCKGKKCPNCKGEIKRITLGGRGTFYCPACQK